MQQFTPCRNCGRPILLAHIQPSCLACVMHRSEGYRALHPAEQAHIDAALRDERPLKCWNA